MATLATVRARRVPGHPLLGSIREYGRDPLHFFTNAARAYGDLVAFRFGFRKALLVSHPDLIEEVLIARHADYVKTPVLRQSALLLGNGLLTAEGEVWRRRRRLSQPAFHRSRIALYSQVMADYAERLVSTWHDGEVRDVHGEMTRLTLEIVAKTLFGADVTDQTSRVRPAMEMVLESFERHARSLVWIPLWIPTPANRRYRRAARWLDSIVVPIIAERRRSGEDRGDLLSMLLASEREDEVDGGRQASLREIRDDVMTLFLAGHETTAIALSWTLYLLAQHPEVEALLQAELAEVLGGRTPTFDDLRRLEYTQHVIAESLRLYPPAWGLGRQAIRETTIGGNRVDRGTIVVASQWVVHRDPRFFEAPEAFRPERWAGEATKLLPKLAYFPFGGGPRLCIGNHFALTEAALVLATIAQRYRLELVPGQRIVPAPSMTLRPSGPIQMRLARR